MNGKTYSETSAVALVEYLRASSLDPDARVDGATVVTVVSGSTLTALALRLGLLRPLPR